MTKSALIRAEINKLKIKAEAAETIDEFNGIKASLDLQEGKLALALKEEEDARAENDGNPLPTKVKPKANINLGEIVAKAIVGTATTEELSEIKNLMQEGVGEKGGVLVPKDVKTKIIELQRRSFDIRKYIDTEKTSVDKGSRTKEANEPEATGFASVDEGAEIQKLHEPTLEEVEYAIRKYAGYIPITNELIKDTPENLLTFILKWMAKNELNTYAYQVFNGTGVKAAEGIMGTAIEEGGKLVDRVTEFDGLPKVSDFKSILNLDLDDVDTDSIVIFTNSSGYDHIDNLEDGNGKSYLQPDATKASGHTFLGKETVKVPTKFLKAITRNAKVYTPFIIGDLKLLYTMYDREQMLIESTKIGGSAWRTDTTEIKGGFRFDGKVNGDPKAVKILLATLTPAQ
ncbi:MAG: phage major capsid protein [Psychrilyobacter sp.]|uniref:phage major capsid protein n=1 Tax=Psychrilyobacter sp. TaxID=2586924 RepID=UPI003C7457C2